MHTPQKTGSVVPTSSGGSTIRSRVPVIEVTKKVDSDTNSTNLERAEACLQLGSTYQAQGNISQALTRFEEALNLFRELDQDNTNALKIAGIIHTMGQLCQLENDNQYALAYFQSALDAYDSINSDEQVNNLADIHRRMGEIYGVNNDPTSAKKSLSQALAMYKQMPTQNHETIATIEGLMSKIHAESRRKIVAGTLSNVVNHPVHQIEHSQTRGSNEQPLIGTNDPSYYGSFRQHSNSFDSIYSEPDLTAQFKINENEESMLAYLCSCCGLFGSRSTKKQGSALSDSLANEIPTYSRNDSI